MVQLYVLFLKSQDFSSSVSGTFFHCVTREHISEDWVQAVDQSGATTMECANTENELRFTFLEQRGKQKIKAKHRPVSVGKCVVLANFFRLYI